AVNNDTNGPNGLPSVTSDITIRGAGVNRTVLVRDASSPAFRIVHVAATGVLTLDGLTVSGGSDEVFSTGAGGGGIVNFGKVTLLNSSVSRNETTRLNVGGVGGIANFNGTVTIINSSISDNSISPTAAGIGSGVGGIDNSGGTVSLLNSSISDNFAGPVGI